MHRPRVHSDGVEGTCDCELPPPRWGGLSFRSLTTGSVHLRRLHPWLHSAAPLGRSDAWYGQAERRHAFVLPVG